MILLWMSFANSAGSRGGPSPSSTRIITSTRLPVLATELVQSKPDLLVTIGPQNTRAARNATSDIPIVMLFVADPVGLGLASSLAHPGGNLTGVSHVAFPGEFTSKAIKCFARWCRRPSVLAVFINPSNETHRLLYPKEAPPTAAKLGFQLDLFELRGIEEVPGAIAAAKAGGAAALSLWADPILATHQTGCPSLRHRRACRRSRYCAALPKRVD